MKLDLDLEVSKILEDLYIRQFKLKKLDIAEIEKNEELKEIVLYVFNGLDVNKSTKSYLDIKDKIKKYNLDEEKFYTNTTIPKDLRFFTEYILYIDKGFIFKISMAKNTDEIFRLIKEGCKKLDNYYINNKPISSRLMFWAPQCFQVTLFNIFSNGMKKEDRIKYGKNLYFSSDYGSNGIDYGLVSEIFGKNKLNKDKYITIYRGVGSKSTSLYKAFAWTKSLNVAKFFATRFIHIEKDLNEVKVYKLDICMEDIISMVGGIEDEVIVDTSSIDYYIDNDLIEEVSFDNTVFYPLKENVSNLT